jgi:hypothetical protein
MKPNPGSDEAIAMGCSCPRMDNGYGRGSYKDGWVINLSCPVHNVDPKDFMDSVGITR